jgi:hypothetical protein
MLKIYMEYERYFAGKINGHFPPSFSLFRYKMSDGICHRAVVYELGMIRNQMEKHSISENGRSA